MALFVNESTRLPVFVRLAPAATLVSRFVTDLGVVFAAHGLDPRFVDSELAAMTEYRLEKTASRSVVGTMMTSRTLPTPTANSVVSMTLSAFRSS